MLLAERLHYENVGGKKYTCAICNLKGLKSKLK